MDAGTKVTIQMLSTLVRAGEFSGTPRPSMLGFLQQLGRVRANQIRPPDAEPARFSTNRPPRLQGRP